MLFVVVDEPILEENLIWDLHEPISFPAANNVKADQVHRLELREVNLVFLQLLFHLVLIIEEVL